MGGVVKLRCDDALRGRLRALARDGETASDVLRAGVDALERERQRESPQGAR